LINLKYIAVFRPIQGIQVGLLRCIAYINAVTLPGMAMMVVLVKEQGWHLDTFLGYLSLLGWITCYTIVLWVVLKIIKFRK
jgi:hypothetical protein